MRYALFLLACIGMSTTAAAQQPPRTPGNAVAVSVELTAEDITVLNGVNFAHNSAELTQLARGRLLENIEQLRRYPRELMFAVIGYAAENEDNRERLAEARAEAVLQFLHRHGVENCYIATSGGTRSITSGNKSDRGEVEYLRSQDRRVELQPFTCEGECTEEVRIVYRDRVVRDTVHTPPLPPIVVTRYVPQQRGASIEFSFGVSVAAGEFTLADADRRLQSQQGNLPVCDDGGPLRTQCGTMDARNLMSISGHASYLFDLGRGWGAGPSLGAGVAIFEGQPLDDRDTRHPFKDSAIFGDAGVAVSKEIGSDWTIGARATYRYAPKYSDLEAEHGLGVGLTLGRRF